MKLLIDMNLSPHWTSLLRDAGWEALHWSSVGKGNEPDSEIMDYAAKHDYVVITHDLDFSAILAATHGDKPSVVQLRTADISHRTIADHVIAALRFMAKELEVGALLTISQRQTRVRMLPLVRRE